MSLQVPYYRHVYLRMDSTHVLADKRDASD